MRDYLLDLVKHTYGLGAISLIKIIGDQDKTLVSAYDTVSKTCVLSAEFKNPIAEFQGTFGMPNLDKLNTILNIPEYREDADITCTTQADNEGNLVPSGILFKNKAGDFQNMYRFMEKNTINAQMGTPMAKPSAFALEIVPTVSSIQKLKFQSQAHSEATVFSTRVENGQVLVRFGDHSSHAGNFVFADNCGSVTIKEQYWPVSVFNDILSLSGDKTIKFSNTNPICQIVVDSGLAVYTYSILPQAK